MAGKHEEYGKRVLNEAFGSDFEKGSRESFGKTRDCGSFTVDGIIYKGEIAVEIESRTSKQVRGAVVDLLCHPAPQKLLLLIKAYNNSFTKNQCEFLMERFNLPSTNFRIVELQGDGDDDSPIEQDVEAVKQAVNKLQQC